MTAASISEFVTAMLEGPITELLALRDECRGDPERVARIEHAISLLTKMADKSDPDGQWRARDGDEVLLLGMMKRAGIGPAMH